MEGDDQKHEHRPEFIFIEEDESYQGHGGTHSQEYFESLKQLQDRSFPFSMRLFMIATAFAVLLFNCIVILLLLLNGFVIICSFGLVQQFVETEKKYWRWFRRLWVFFFGLMVAAFNPVFGIGIIMLYFFTQGDDVSDELMGKFVKSRFKM
ncbi:MAG: hypothetical protein H7A37_02840 [Chlamydiales bacterium]|nr:hypothetical protein [Chlamydiia bacterium]MCP5507222.1 hypothetical protein [Chlamydiales bacterium]